MKIVSINFIKEVDMTERTRNTESAKVVGQIAEKLKGAPKGTGLSIPVTDAAPWQRYAMQRRLQKAGCKCLVSWSKDKKALEVRRAE
jgi:hypothetical protein